MRIIVTGGAGFIGSAVVRLLLDETEHDVLVLDKLSYAGNLANLDGYRDRPRLRFVRADIADAQAVGRAFADFRPDGLINLAAETHVDRSIDGPRAFVDTNVTGTCVLLEAARQTRAARSAGGVAPFRFHHVSTDEVYGALGTEGMFAEDDAYRPNSPYSATKAASDHLVRAWHKTYGVETVTTNASNNYGPFQFPEKLIPKTILSILASQPITVYGQGLNVRDWIHVEDHARGILTVFERGRPGETYNIGGGTELRNIDIVSRLCSLLDAHEPHAQGRPHADLIRFVDDRPGHDFRYAVDCSKVRSELGWEPRFNCAEGLAQTVRWYLDNRRWWQQLLQRGEPLARIGQAVARAAP